LRVEGKKLRYLLEFFGSLYDDRLIGPMINDLRKLQDNLGELNDLRMRADALRSFAGELSGREDVDVQCLRSIDDLLGRISRRMTKVRGGFARRWSKFSARNAVGRFMGLLEGRTTRRAPAGGDAP